MSYLAAPQALGILTQWTSALARLGAGLQPGDGREVALKLAPVMGRTGHAILDDEIRSRGVVALLELPPSRREALLRTLAEQLPPQLVWEIQTDATVLKRALGATRPVKIVALGDIHNEWHRPQAILDHEFPYGHGIALAAGDLGSYPILSGGHRVYFIHGNHEDFDRVAAIHEGTDPAKEGFTAIFAGEVISIGALTVAGLPGIYSPLFYEHPHKTHPLKYIAQAQVEAMRAIQVPIDILLIHPAPHGLGIGKGGEDHGTHLFRGLVEYLRPRLVLFGHHHRRFVGRLGKTHVVGLDYPHRSYVVIDFDPVEDKVRLTEERAWPQAGPGPTGEYQFGWQRGLEAGGIVLFEGPI